MFIGSKHQNVGDVKDIQLVISKSFQIIPINSFREISWSIDNDLSNLIHNENARWIE